MLAMVDRCGDAANKGGKLVFSGSQSRGYRFSPFHDDIGATRPAFQIPIQRQGFLSHRIVVEFLDSRVELDNRRDIIQACDAHFRLVFAIQSPGIQMVQPGQIGCPYI